MVYTFIRLKALINSDHAATTRHRFHPRGESRLEATLTVLAPERERIHL